MIIWEDPPPRPVNRLGGCPPGRSRRDWYAIGAHLRDKPGEWARVTTAPSKTSASSIAGYINQGRNAVLRAGFEATSRTVDDEYRVYVRYVGGAE